MEFSTAVRREGGRDLPLLVWRCPTPMMAISSSPHGGGLGVRHWVLNAQVASDYARRDPDRHLGELAACLGLTGCGVGLLTAADVRARTSAHDEGVEVTATVGLREPILAAAPPASGPITLAGTINLVAALPEPMSDAGLVNAVATVTEAKTQALRELGLHATGTATDAVCILCPTDGTSHAFGGPRSLWGSRLARATYEAVLAGARP